MLSCSLPLTFVRGIEPLSMVGPIETLHWPKLPHKNTVGEATIILATTVIAKPYLDQNRLSETQAKLKYSFELSFFDVDNQQMAFFRNRYSSGRRSLSEYMYNNPSNISIWYHVDQLKQKTRQSAPKL